MRNVKTLKLKSKTKELIEKVLSTKPIHTKYSPQYSYRSICPFCREKEDSFMYYPYMSQIEHKEGCAYDLALEMKHSKRLKQ